MCNEICRKEWAITVLRLMLGLIFIMHGAQKVFGLFGGPGLEGFIAWAGPLGIPTPLAYAAAFAELIGGILLFLGVFTWLGGLLTTSVMIGAIYFVHSGHGFFIQNNGYEYVLLLIVATLAVTAAGSRSLLNWKNCCDQKCEA